MIITTSPSIEGHSTTAYLGIVSGETEHKAGCRVRTAVREKGQ